jgi:hypothetical protein
MATVLVFAAILTYIFTLYHPPPSGPARSQRIGWQSWDIVMFGSKKSDDTKGTSGVSTGGAGTGTGTGSGSGTSKQNETNSTVDWWEQPDQTPAENYQSLPLDIWAPLLNHHTGLTDIAIKPCYFPPWMVDFCWPATTPEEDATKGKWVRVERDLNWKTGIWYLNLYYRRSRRLDVDLITDIQLLEEGNEDKLPPPRSAWRRATTPINDGVRPKQRPIALWFKLRPPLQKVSDEKEIEEAITELDILYGDGRPWYGFRKANRPVVATTPQAEGVWVTYRKGVKPVPKARPLHFSREGTFKIMQVADLHYSVGTGKCLQADIPNCKDADGESNNMLGRALDAEKPDLVIFTGDQLNGGSTSWDSRSVLAKVISTVVDRNISWAAIFGNHDDQSTNMDRRFQMQHLAEMPYSLCRAGPHDVDGVGNYYLKVYSPDASKTQILTVYFLDSHGYAKKTLANWWGPAEYDWIKPTQREWYEAISKKMPLIQRPFVPDGGKDLGHSWARNENLESRQAKLAKPNAMMFFHIPLPEAYNSADLDRYTSKPLDVGQRLDAPGAPKHNSGFFEGGVLKMPESEEGGTEIKVIGNGHCHLSDNCRRVKGVWMCFGGGGSYSGYGRIGFDRRFRIYQVSDFGETIGTYKRTEHGTIVDKMFLVGKNAPAL